MLAADAHLHTRPSPAPARPGGSTRARESDPRRRRSPVPPPAIKRQIPATGAKGSDALGRARRSLLGGVLHLLSGLLHRHLS
jgi:hypothetical protein